MAVEVFTEFTSVLTTPGVSRRVQGSRVLDRWSGDFFSWGCFLSAFGFHSRVN